jgi:anti-sigma regulatory factor (Ser/Thr protein kinase)
MARHRMADFLAGRVDDEVAGTAALLVSELVSNVVVHGLSGGDISATMTAHCLRVEVADGNPVLPRRPPETPPRGRSGGFGLVLVDEFAQRWGAEQTPGGKRVWFELDVS